MALVLITSLGASPGATTSAIGLALHWPCPVLLADLDRHAQQSITAGFQGTAHVGGMMSLLQGLRQSSSVQDAVMDHTIRLTDREDQRLLPGFTRPGAHDIFTGWRDLADCFARLHDDGVDVLADLGRSTADSLPADLLRVADRMLLVTRSSLRSIVPLGMHLAGVRERLEAQAPSLEPELLVIGPDRPYPAREMAAHFQTRADLHLPWSPEEAAVLSDAAPAPRRVRRLQQGLATMAARLHRELGRDQVTVPNDEAVPA